MKDSTGITENYSGNVTDLITGFISVSKNTGSEEKRYEC